MKHTLGAVAEVLHYDPRTVVDDNGDIRPRSDFGSDDYPDQSPEQYERQVLGYIVGLCDEADSLEETAKRGSGDRVVRKYGGIKKVMGLSNGFRRHARDAFFRLHGAPAIEPTDGIGLYEYYETVAKWYKFRQEIKDPDARNELRQGLL